MLRLMARGKINWSLDIIGVRADGYHLMDMLMESVALHDTLALSPAASLALTIGGRRDLPAANNLVLKAAHALQAACGVTCGASIRLEKRIPVGAGMGGGSADAAAALIGLNMLWNTGLDLMQLQALALPLGADIPFMLEGGIARVGGIGEDIRPLPAAPAMHVVLVQPCPGLATRTVFSAFDGLPAVKHPLTDAAQTSLLARDMALLNTYAGNVLLQASLQARPQIGEAIAALEACDAEFANMTGSGSAVFGAFHQAVHAQAAYRVLKKRWQRCWLTQTAPQGIIWEVTGNP